MLPLLLPLPLPLLLPSPALAQDTIPVLISGFQGLDAESVPLAMELPELLTEVLEDEPDLDLLLLSKAPKVHDQSASLYMETCPEGEVVGCTYVVSEAAGAAFALTGTVRRQGETAPLDLDEDEEPPPPELLIDLLILDIGAYEEALQVELIYTQDTANSFADTVPEMLNDVIEGYVGQVVDIRVFEPDDDLEEEYDREVAAQELSALEGELGEVAGSRTHGDLTTKPTREDRPRISHKELLAKYEGKNNPWDEIELSSREYLNWHNSGWDYNSWSRRFDGRKGQLMFRVHGGWGQMPSHGLYWGRVALDEYVTTQEAYASQETAVGSALQLGLGVGYGLSPTLELELGVAREGGQYLTDIKQQNHDGSLTDRSVERFPQGPLHAFAGARIVPSPTSTLRPLIGAGVGYWMGRDVTVHTDIPLSALPEFGATHILSVRGLVGAELRLSDHFDLVLQAPLHLLLSGTSPQVYDEDYGVLTEEHDPGNGPFLAGGIQLAAQARL